MARRGWEPRQACSLLLDERTGTDNELAGVELHERRRRILRFEQNLGGRH